MSEIIDTVIVVDTEGLNRAYPSGGSPSHASGLDAFFKVLVDSEHGYQDPEHDVAGTRGIQCKVNDMIYFRAIAKADIGNDVLIEQFADMSQGVDPSQMTNYLAAPTFQTSVKRGFAYNNDFPTQPQFDWLGWRRWVAVTQEVERVDPHMSVQALQSTAQLQHKHIRYTLGFKVKFSNGMTRRYLFDPAIKITD